MNPDPLQRPDVRVAICSVELDWTVPTAASAELQEQRVIEAINAAADRGAQIVVFPEGALASPHKRAISSSPAEVREADWTKLDWALLRAQLDRVCHAARSRAVWVIVGAPHQLSEGVRPHNSLYVISDTGSVVTRYDKRRLSTTEVSYMFTPGLEPIIFEACGLKIGLVIGLEMLFPELFTEYADAGADLVVAASHGGGIFGQLASSYAVVNQVPVALCIPPAPDETSRSGVYSTDGSSIQVATPDEAEVLVVSACARDLSDHATFNYRARHGFYDDRLVPSDPRSLDRTAL